MSQLLPCPFCGTENPRLSPADGTYDRAWCVNCMAEICSHNAVQDWNRRALPPASQEMGELEEPKWVQHMRIATLDRIIPHESEYLAYVDALLARYREQGERADYLAQKFNESLAETEAAESRASLLSEKLERCERALLAFVVYHEPDNQTLLRDLFKEHKAALDAAREGK